MNFSNTVIINDTELEETSLTKEEEQLVREITELNNAITKTKLRTNFKIGQKINNFYEKEYGQESFKKISVHTGINTNTLYKMCQSAKEFTDDDIDLFCDGGDFPVAYKHIKAFLPLGRDVIMNTFVSAANQQEFVSTLKTLHKSSRKSYENCPQGTKFQEQSDEQLNKKEVADNQFNATTGGESDSSQNGDEDSTNFDKIETELNQQPSPQEIEGNNSTGNDSNDGDTDSALEDALTATITPVDEITAPFISKGITIDPATPKANTNKNSAIKREAGNSLPPNSPKSNSGGTINDLMMSKFSNNDSDTIDLVAAKLQLSALEATNKQLLERIAELETENSELKQEVARLSSQQPEEWFDTDVEDSLQSYEKEEEKELEIA